MAESGSPITEEECSHTTTQQQRRHVFAPQHCQGSVEGTSDDAAVSKLSAANLGYLDDPFLHYFVKKQKRRAPLINRGYFARMIALETVAKDFVRLSSGRCQVVSLGAGQDTLFFRLAKHNLSPTKFFEVDLPSVTHLKTQVLQANSPLQQMVLSEDPHKVYKDAVESSREPDQGKTFPDSIPRGPRYSLITANLADLKTVTKRLEEEGLDYNLPTLFISECVLVYMEPDDSNRLIDWAGNSFPYGVFVTYEQIHPDDAFGNVMQQNLASRGASLKGLRSYPTLTDHAKRYAERGWSFVSVSDMNDIYYKYIPKDTLTEAEKLEIFDEFEEWHMMMGHYCIAIAVNDRDHKLTFESDSNEETVQIPENSLLRLLWSQHIYRSSQISS